MAVKEGDSIPSIVVTEMVDGAPTPTPLADLTKGKKIVFFAVPGAFTPTCSAKHLPGFVDQAAALKGKGVDEICCLSVNDAFVMDAWGKSANAAGKVRMLADGNGELAAAMGLEMDASKFGMGTRSQRYAMVVNDGKVEKIMVEGGPGLSVSSAESVLSSL